MKATELRIGNLYSQFGNITEVSWCTIKDMEKAPESQLWCKPIPLTEEWLLKFGFEKAGRTIKLKNFGKFIDMNGELSFYPAGMLNSLLRHDLLQYVHQLQNLYFALTGKELMIK